MRDRLLKLLRNIENKQVYKTTPADFSTVYDADATEEDFNEYYRNTERENLLKLDYEKFFGEIEKHSMVRAFLVFPNYDFIIKQINSISDKKVFSENSIKAELKRMENDGLIVIGTQNIQEYLFETDGAFNVVLKGKAWTVNTESVILTTNGKNKWRYFFVKMMENPFTAVMSFVALVVSIIALFK